MSARLWIRLAEIIVTIILAGAIVEAWRAERNDRAQLAAELANAKVSLAQADARQHDRDTQLLQTLSTLATDKRTVTTPAQVISQLPLQIPLPTPIVLQSAPPVAAAPGATTTASASTTVASPQAPGAIIPAEDLKPLYDFAVDCKACQAKLTAAQGDLTDEKSKTTTLTQERDVAVQAAKGGTVLHRVVRAAKWFALGAAAGALAARAAH
ncbi:MAG TPA: hypothetical protein VGI16_06545 [Candidatus Acidoferrum sp.]|jgi:type II secretory pathway pseudopilin PulG